MGVPHALGQATHSEVGMRNQLFTTFTSQVPAEHQVSAWFFPPTLQGGSHPGNLLP